MRFFGATGSVVGIIIAWFVQLVPDIDELVKFLAWALPTAITLVSWCVQIFITARRVKKLFIEDLMKKIDKRLDEIQPEIAKQAVDEVWTRIDTINKLTTTDEPTRDTSNAG